MEINADVSSRAELPEIPGDPLALERQVCFALSIAARSVLSIYRPILEPMGLTHPQYLEIGRASCRERVLVAV